MDILKKLGSINYATLVISAIVLVVIVVFKEVIEKRLKNMIPFPIPIDLIIVSYWS